MWQYTAGRLPLSQPTKLLMTIRIVLWFFSSLARGISHSLTNTQNTQPRGWKKRRTNNHRLGLAPSARREKSVTLLCILCFCGLTRACTRAKLPQATSNADLSSCVGQHGICRLTDIGSRLSDFSWLVSFLPCSHLLMGYFSWLLCSADCLWDLPSFVIFRSRGRPRAQALCVRFAPKQTKEFFDRHLRTPTKMNAQHRVVISYKELICRIKPNQRHFSIWNNWLQWEAFCDLKLLL